MPTSWNTFIFKFRLIFATDERRIMSGKAFHVVFCGSPLIRVAFVATDQWAALTKSSFLATSLRARRQELSACWVMTWSLCVLNLVNLWRMDMKISMILWKHKMAPGWRHGWVITLKRGGTRFLMKPNILWKFEDQIFEINEGQN